MTGLIQLQSVIKPKGQSSVGRHTDARAHTHAHLIDRVQFSQTLTVLALKTNGKIQKKEKTLGKKAKCQNSARGTHHKATPPLDLLQKNRAEEKKKTSSIRTW